MSDLILTPMDQAAARAVVDWHYPPPYNLYSIGADPLGAAFFLSSVDRGYFQLRDRSGELVAFCCFGEEGRVPGGDYRAPALDLGIGVRPDLTGRGEGMRYLAPVIAFGVEQYRPPLLRLTVAAFNTRAIRLYAKAGFAEVGSFYSALAGRDFIVMTRPALPPAE
jgi:RimJ/RimL family protein N-acetyltransferase